MVSTFWYYRPVKSQGLTLEGFEISVLVHHRTWSLFVGRLGTLLPHIGLALIIVECLAWQLLGCNYQELYT